MCKQHSVIRGKSSCIIILIVFVFVQFWLNTGNTTALISHFTSYIVIFSFQVWHTQIHYIIFFHFVFHQFSFSFLMMRTPNSKIIYNNSDLRVIRFQLQMLVIKIQQFYLNYFLSRLNTLSCHMSIVVKYSISIVTTDTFYAILHECGFFAIKENETHGKLEAYENNFILHCACLCGSV